MCTLRFESAAIFLRLQAFDLAIAMGFGGDAVQARKRHININSLVQFPLGPPGSVPRVSPGFVLTFHSGSPVCPRNKPSLSRTRGGRKAAEKNSCVKIRSGDGKPNQRRSVHELFAGAFWNRSSIWIVLVLLRKNTRTHEKCRNSWTFRFGPFFALVCWGDSCVKSFVV